MRPGERMVHCCPTGDIPHAGRSYDGVVAMFRAIRWLRGLRGYDKHSAETFDRLTRSSHVEDLRWIALVALVSAIVGVLASAAMGMLAAGAIQISAGLVGVGGILAWCYQTGSARLGIVDLFACEITTVCRICTINSMADNCIEAFKLDVSRGQKIRERLSRMESSENYTPIFDSNAKELRNLEAKVVINITAFYTYWKAGRDAIRKLDKASETSVAVADANTEAWRRAMLQIIYLQFLTFESARKAVRDLVEFEPTHAENTITILISELPLYRFLLDNFSPGDMRHTRLQLRLERYHEIVPQLCDYTEKGHA